VDLAEAVCSAASDPGERARCWGRVHHCSLNEVAGSAEIAVVVLAAGFGHDVDAEE
jgi:hypothetical protein